MYSYMKFGTVVQEIKEKVYGRRKTEARLTKTDHNSSS